MWTTQNYYSYTEQLLFGLLHFTRVLYPFFSKLLLSYYQTAILETEKDYWIIYKQKGTFES